MKESEKIKKAAAYINALMCCEVSNDMEEIIPAINALIDFFGLKLDEEKFHDDINFKSVNAAHIERIIEDAVYSYAHQDEEKDYDGSILDDDTDCYDTPNLTGIY